MSVLVPVSREDTEVCATSPPRYLDGFHGIWGRDKVVSMLVLGAQWTQQRAPLFAWLHVVVCGSADGAFDAGREPLAITVAATTRTDARLWISPGVASNYGAPGENAS